MAIHLSGKERVLDDSDLIVTKTDTRGIITYANHTFLHFAGYSLRKVIGAPHNIVRHPHMPRCVFRLLWETLGNGDEVFAYVLNLAANGDHYWVFAHVTPSFGPGGETIGFHSNRRSIERPVLNHVIIPLYQRLSDEESRYANAKDGMAASTRLLSDTLAGLGQSYDQFIFSL